MKLHLGTKNTKNRLLMVIWSKPLFIQITDTVWEECRVHKSCEIRIRIENKVWIQEAKMTHKNIRKLKIAFFLLSKQ